MSKQNDPFDEALRRNGQDLKFWIVVGCIWLTVVIYVWG